MSPSPRAQRIALRLSLALFTVAAALFAALMSGGAHAAPATPVATATFYGADTTRLVNAIQRVWPQASGSYCGLAAAEALVNYDDAAHRVPMRFTSLTDQKTLAAANQKAGASMWGHATPTNAYAGVTNIAPDFGADPRSVAYMTWNYTPPNTFFHDYVYRWQFANAAQPSFQIQAQQATTNVARALETWHEPVIVVINGGLHVVLVTAVFSYTDPKASYPARIASVVYRDPMAAPSVSRFEVDFATWSGGHYATPFGMYSLWSLYYGDKAVVGDGKNVLDPEPSVGPYKPTAANPSHWYRGFTWIQRDSNYANGSYSPDYAFTSTGARMSAP